MGYLSLITLGIVVAGATAYLPHEKVRTGLTLNLNRREILAIHGFVS